jgi:hypothetical protein
MLTHNAPTSFSYKNDRFTSPILGALISRLEGEWLFTDLGNGSIKVEWTYRTIPTNFFSSLFIRLVLIRFFTKMLQQAMDIVKKDLETGNLVGATFPPALALAVN